jgi:hypothetical protein
MILVTAMANTSVRPLTAPVFVNDYTKFVQMVKSKYPQGNDRIIEAAL